MKFEVKKLATAFVASFVFLSGAYAEDKPTADREPTNDKEFVAKAIACEVAEIKMAELAKNQTKNPPRPRL